VSVNIVQGPGVKRVKADGKQRATGKSAGKARRVKGNGPTPRSISYDPAHCARLVAHAETGAAVADYADAIGVPPSTLIQWARTNPEFLEALQIALAKLGLEAHRQVCDLRDALLLRWSDRWSDLERHIYAATDAAEADQLMRSLSDIAPKAWLEQAEALLAWIAIEKAGRQKT
jgi:hypothetical protein